jgi:hypothetical protein
MVLIESASRIEVVAMFLKYRALREPEQGRGCSVGMTGI